jgi:hypothetical protein
VVGACWTGCETAVCVPLDWVELVCCCVVVVSVVDPLLVVCLYVVSGGGCGTG